jgi:hypothetical protein
VRGRDGKGPGGGVFIVEKLQALKLSDSFHRFTHYGSAGRFTQSELSIDQFTVRSALTIHTQVAQSRPNAGRGVCSPHIASQSARYEGRPAKDLSLPLSTKYQRLDPSGLRS